MDISNIEEEREKLMKQLKQFDKDIEKEIINILEGIKNHI